MRVFLPVLFIALLHWTMVFGDDEKFDHAHYLSHNVLLEWRFEIRAIVVRLSAETTSWIGFGISPNSTMAGAEMIIGGVYNGTGYLFNANADRNGVPELYSQSWYLISYKEENQTTSFTFRKFLRYYGLFNVEMKCGERNVIWAYGFNDIKGSSANMLNYHAWQRGRMKVDFDPEFKEDDFEYSVELHKDVTLDWYYNSTYITLRFSAPSRGWVGFGFSPNGTMAGADMVIGGINWGEPFCFDAYSDKNGPPIRDKEQNTEVFRVTREGKKTTLVVRKRQNIIGEHDLPIESNMTIIWAHGPLNILYERPSYFNYHLWNRGAKEVTLLPDESIEIERKLGATAITLDDDGEVTMTYKIIGDKIEIELTAPTTGWVGLGYSQTGRMGGADIIIAGVNESGDGYLLDAYATRSGAPLIDYYQNVDLLAASQNGTWTTVKFQRNLYAYDRNDMTIWGREYVIWAYGSVDINQKPSSAHYHGRNKGAVKIKLAADYFS